MASDDELLMRLTALAGAASAGGPDDLERLLAASGGLVHTVVRARLGDTEVAEAAAVDALTKVAMSFGTLEDPVAYPRWLHRIAVRTAIDRMRRRPDRPSIDLGDHAAHAVGSGTPVDTAVAAEQTAAVRRALDALPANQREPLYLHFVDGLTYREIARATGVGLATVDRRMRAGLERLRNRLERMRER